MKRSLQAALALCLILAASPLLAQSADTAEPLWEVHLNLARAYSSPMGKWMRDKMLEDEPEAESKIDDFVEAIGFDPRTEVQDVVVYGSSFEPTDVTIVGKLGNSTGNLEGWILAAPGYRSSELDANTLVHSFIIEHHDRTDRMWCVLPKAATGDHYMLVASFQEQRALELARTIRSGAATRTPANLQNDTVISIAVNDLSSVPLDIDNDKPGAAILQTIKSFALNLASSSNELRISLDVTAASPAKARQLSQLLTGVKAMAQLVPADEEEAKLALETLQGLAVSHTEGDTHLSASLTVNVDVLRKLSDH